MLNFLMAFFVAASTLTPDRMPTAGGALIRTAPLTTDGTLRLPPSDDAASTYEELLSMSTRERLRMFKEMPSSLKSGVWAHHLLTTMARHPEFTSEQRAVIQEALSLLTPELFEIEPTDPHWAELVDLPLRRLQRRAIAAFDGKVARELFTELGPEAVQPGSTSDQNSAAGKPTPAPHVLAPLRIDHPVVNSAPDCTCSVVSDWCDTSGLGFYYCKNAWCVLSASGCGTFLRYACEGLCFIKN